jgi:hypothetical protein
VIEQPFFACQYNTKLEYISEEMTNDKQTNMDATISNEMQYSTYPSNLQTIIFIVAPCIL